MSNLPNVEKQKILLVDNNADDINQISDIVSGHFELVLCNDENKASEIIKDSSQKISSAIIYIKQALPILQKIRQIPLMENFPVLIITDIPNSNLEDALLELDAIDFLKKPFNERRVLTRIKTAVKLFEANRIIQELEHDELTGLLTRQAFLRKTEEVRDQNPDKTFCIVAFDFDNFKSSNTLYGEEKCDEFLMYTAKQMRAARPYDISGRFGGDQFVLFFDYVNLVNVDLINRIKESIIKTAPIPHQVVKIGIYAPIDSKIPLVICCDRAFMAIRKIKGIYGKDIAFYENSIQKQLLNEKRIIETMEQALENEQFQIFYQPKHETITGKIAGAEALVRWNHPEYGFMSPGQFIPLFEKNGFITKLDNFVLEKVCKDIKHWKENNIPLVPVSVNLSRCDFMENGCIEKQVEMIDRYQIDHNLLHMEVTESLYSQNIDIIISQVKRVQELGFLIEMDDFGAGYSTLGLLATFPLDVLKLDISFVRNIKENEIVIENIIKMAHRMGLMTIAEGTESAEQFMTLKALGCDFIQGYYFSQPLSLSNYESYIKSTCVLDTKYVKLERFPNTNKVWNNEKMLLAANEIAEGIPGGFFSYHADDNYEIISFNSELMHMFDCKTAEEFREYTHNSFKGIILEEDFDYVQSSIKSQVTDENTIDFVEYRIRTKDGIMKNVRDYSRFVKTEKYGDIFYVFLNDITEEERKKIRDEEEQLKKLELRRAAEFAKRTNKAKNIFMYNIAKDILEPMKFIIECTNNIRNNTSNINLIEENLEKAKKSEEHLLSFVNNILELSKLENNEITLTENPSDITDSVNKIYVLIEEAAKKKNIKVEYWSEITNPYIYQDVIHTTDVVLNILQNALKYTPEGGKIRFGIKQSPGKDEKECIIDFICEDTGIGISKEFLPHIYENFAREENEVNAEIPSSGLGLNLVKALISLMNGTIEIKSEKGKGTTVRTSQPHRYANKNDIKNDTTLATNLKAK
ncbi:MAG: EAL domain-containing protein [Spirochaetaceae bacterium]|nr:EAL domain-containing protein [Spirochaetaceae bacterium]